MKPTRLKSCLRLGLFLLFCIGVDPAAATEKHASAEQVLDLGALVREATENNPEIKAARQRWEASRAVVPQVGTLPDPKAQVGYQRMPMMEPLEGPMYGIGQEIPFPGKLQLREDMAGREAERMEAEYAAVRFRVIARLKEAYFNLHFVHESIDVVERNKLLLMQFEKTATARYAVGKAVQQDVFRAQVEISRVLERLAILEQRKESLHADVNRIVNRPPSNQLGAPHEVPVIPLTRSLAEINTLIETSSPLLRASAKGVERGEQAVALARREYYPDFDLSVLGLRNDRINDNGYQLMLGVKIPLYFVTKQREGVREARALRESAAQDLQTVRQMLLFQAKDNVVQAQRAERLIKLLRDAIIPQAGLALESALAGYAVGKVDFLTLLNSLLTLQENELELHGEMVEHGKALARLEELVGGSFQ